MAYCNPNYQVIFLGQSQAPYAGTVNSFHLIQFSGHKERYAYESWFPRQGELYPEQLGGFSQGAQQLGSN